MCDDLKADWQRYVKMFRPVTPNRPPDNLRVLLSSPGFLVVAGYRITFWLRQRHKQTGSHFLKYIGKMAHRLVDFFAVTAMKTRITYWPIIGPGLYLSNKGGIIIGPTKLGASCTIHHNVTIGKGAYGDRGRPEIGDRVWIGPDTVIYGAITIGDGSVIRGFTVLGKNVPDNCLVGGKPGRFERRNYDNSGLLDNPDAYPDYDKVDTDRGFSSDKQRPGSDE